MAQVEVFEYKAPLHPGTVVRYHRRPEQFWVVVAAVRSGTAHRIYPLGGDPKGFTGVGHGSLTVVSLAELQAAFAANELRNA